LPYLFEGERFKKSAFKKCRLTGINAVFANLAELFPANRRFLLV